MEPVCYRQVSSALTSNSSQEALKCTFKAVVPEKAPLVIDLPQFNVAEDEVGGNARIQPALGQKDQILKLLLL